MSLFFFYLRTHTSQKPNSDGYALKLRPKKGITTSIFQRVLMGNPKGWCFPTPLVHPFSTSWKIQVYKCDDPRNLQRSDPRSTDPEKTWESNSSIATSISGSVGIRSYAVFDGDISLTKTATNYVSTVNPPNQGTPSHSVFDGDDVSLSSTHSLEGFVCHILCAFPPRYAPPLDLQTTSKFYKVRHV